MDGSCLVDFTVPTGRYTYSSILVQRGKICQQVYCKVQQNKEPKEFMKRERRKASETRELVFVACGAILHREGLAALTLDAVAEEAGLSKGGLLYHFPTKLALVEALFRHHLDLFDLRIDALRQADILQDQASWLRAYAQASIEQISDADTASLFASLFAAGERYPSVLQIMRDYYVAWQAQIDDSGLSASSAMMIRLTVDGFWFAHLYQYSPPTGAQRAEVINYIMRLTENVS